VVETRTKNDNKDNLLTTIFLTKNFNIIHFNFFLIAPRVIRVIARNEEKK